MSKTTPVRWWRDDKTRYQSRPPYVSLPDCGPHFTPDALDAAILKSLDDLRSAVMGRGMLFTEDDLRAVRIGAYRRARE